MNEYKLSHVATFDQISLRLKDGNLLRDTVVGYLYKDSDDKGIYVYAFLSEKGMAAFEDALAKTSVLLSDDEYDRIVERHTCSYFFPWSEVAYLQLD
jgi:hypothetical protein